MATITWPASRDFTPSSMQIGLSAPGTSWAAAYSGPVQRISNLNDRLTARLTLPPLSDKTAAGQREALLFGLKTTGDLVSLHHVARPYPNGTLRGSPTISGAVLAGATSITLANCWGTNLLRGDSFEADTNADGLGNSWSSYSIGTVGSVTYSRISSGAVHGTYRQRVSASNLGTGTSDRAGFVQVVAVSPSTQYVVSAYLGNPTASPKAILRLDWFNASSTLVGSSQSVQFTPSGSMVRNSHTATSPATAATVAVYVWIEANAAGPGLATLDFDAVQLEPGSVASSFPQYPTLIGGDMLGVGGKLLQVGYAGSTANDSGVMSVPLSMATRAAISDGAAVTWSKPTTTWQVVGFDPQLDYGGGLVQAGPEVMLIEA